MLKIIKKFSKKQEGVAATEFAIIAPVLLTILLGVVEFSHYQLLERRMSTVTIAAAEYVSRDTDNTLSINEFRQVRDMWAFVVPTYGGLDEGLTAGHFQTVDSKYDTRRMGKNSFSLNSIELQALENAERDPDCKDAAHCGLKPVVKWVGGSNLTSNTSSASEQPSCDAQFVEDASEAGPTNIPQGFAGVSSMISVERRALYKPLITGNFLPEQVIRGTATRKTRTGDFLERGGSRWMIANSKLCEE